MKRFGMLLAMVSMFSLPGLLFAQATGGSTCSAAKEGAGKTTGGKKKIFRERKGVGKKGASKTKTGSETKAEACTGKKPGTTKQ